MKKIIKLLTGLFGTCLGLGIIVSIIEKKKGKVGWVEGHKPYGIYEEHLKRPLDFTLALFALIIFWPVLLIIAIAVRINMGSPVVFEQERPGLGGKIFKIKKFRTMTDERDEEGNLLPDEMRLTKFGKWLRSTSLDELPELINIVNGDMAIVGPRPLLVNYLPWYTKEENHRHDVRPGLTGLAQVNGRNNLGWNERFVLDLEYMKNIKHLTDFAIVYKTIRKVFVKEDIIIRGTYKSILDFDVEQQINKNNRQG